MSNSKESEDFVGGYPKIPLPFVCAPEDGIIIERRQDDFFKGIVAELGYTAAASSVFCRIRSRELLRENDLVVSGNETNDRVTELLICERTVAAVLKIRTDSNFVQVLFGLYVTREIEDQLRFKP